MKEKLCIFCTNFRWTEESCWGMGSALTGPMTEGGDATCAAGQYKDWPRPKDDEEWRALILRGEDCPAYDCVYAEKESVSASKPSPANESA